MTRHRAMRTYHIPNFVPLLATLPLLGALIIWVPSASASPTQSQLASQAAQLTSSIALQSSQIHQFAVAANAANTRLFDAQLKLDSANRTLALDSVALRHSKNVLAEIALEEFTSTSGAQSLINLMTSTQSDFVARIEYERVMGLNANTAIFAYRAALAQQTAQIAVATAAKNQAEAARAQILVSQSSLATVVEQEQASLASVNGQIAALVQQQLAAKLAAQLSAEATSSQGAPTPAGVGAVARNQAGVANWGGIPAPPSPAAFAALRQCESSDNYQDNTGNGYYGAYQFSLSTWHGLGFSGLPSNAPPAEQDLAAQIEQRGGWYAWPECSLLLGFV